MHLVRNYSKNLPYIYLSKFACDPVFLIKSYVHYFTPAHPQSTARSHCFTPKKTRKYHLDHDWNKLQECLCSTPRAQSPVTANVPVAIHIKLNNEV